VRDARFLPAVVAGDVLSGEHEAPWLLRRQRAGPPLEALNPEHSDLLLLKCASCGRPSAFCQARKRAYPVRVDPEAAASQAD